MTTPSSGEDFNRIDALKKRLYDRDKISGVTRRSVLTANNTDAPTMWAKSESVQAPPRSDLSGSWLYKVALASALFFALTLGIAGFWFLQGANLISNRNIDFAINGPAAVKAGDKTSFQILISNRNKLALEQVVLTLEYPEDTKAPGDVTTPLIKTELPIGTIAPGETVNRSLEAALFGNQNDPRTIKGSMAYRVSGSSAVYQKDSVYDLIISAAPLSVAINAVPESIVDHQVTLEVVVTSNAQSTLKNIILHTQYPRGFTPTEVTPAAEKDANTWSLGDMEAGSEKKFTIKGRLSGINNEVKTFQALVGVGDTLGQGLIDTRFSEVFKTITLRQPFVSLETSINGNTSIEPAVTSNSNVRVDLTWGNTLSNKVINNELEVTLSGPAFNPQSVQPSTGFYRLSDQMIRWNQIAVPGLAELTPQESGSASFNFNTYSLFDAPMVAVVNPTVTLKAILAGTRVSDGFSNERIETVINRTIKLDSILRLSAKTLQRTGPFANTGPVPPKVDTETTYTINWSIINTSNDLTDGYVRATLPAGVRFVGEISPASEKLTYNSVTGEVRWDLGKVAAGTGTRLAPRELFFKIAIKPSFNNRGKPFVILPNVTVSAVDTFTGRTLSDNKSSVDTRLQTEPGFETKDALVVE